MSDEDDPVTKAMLDAQKAKAAEAQRQRVQGQKSEERLHAVMVPLKEQVRAALSSIAFFDAGVNGSATVYGTNATLSAVDQFAFTANRRDPQYQATVTVMARYDYGEPPAIGTYDLNPQGRLQRSTGSRMVMPKMVPFDVPITVEQDGALTLDAAAMTASLVKAVPVLEAGGGESQR